MNDDFASVETLLICAEKEVLKTLFDNMELLIGQI